MNRQTSNQGPNSYQAGFKPKRLKYWDDGLRMKHRTFHFLFSNPTRVLIELNVAAKGVLSPQEQIIWTGQPIHWRAALREGIGSIFPLAWTAFALFWTSGFIRQHGFLTGLGGVVFWVLAVLMNLAGIGLIFFRYSEYCSAQRRLYVLTNFQAIVLSHNWKGKVINQSYWLKRSQRWSRRNYWRGSGDLIFHQWEYRTESRRRIIVREGFLDIPDVKRVEQLARNQAQLRKPKYRKSRRNQKRQF